MGGEGGRQSNYYILLHCKSAKFVIKPNNTGHQISFLNTPNEPLPVIKCTLEVDASAGLAERSMRNEGHNLMHNTG